MFLEYRYKLQILKEAKVYETYLDLGKLFKIEHPKTATNTARSYLNGEITPPEIAIETMCNTANISYDFISNNNLKLNQFDSFIVDLLWCGLIDSKYKLKKINEQSNDQYDNVIVFKPNSPILQSYFNEINNIVNNDYNSKCLPNNFYYNKYCLNFPYSSDTHKNYVSHLYEDNKTNTRNYFERTGIIHDTFMGRIQIEELKQQLSKNLKCPKYLSINARANIISKYGSCNYNRNFNLLNYDFKSNKRIIGTTLSFSQAEILEKGLYTPIGLIVPLYKDLEYYMLDSIIWTDIINKSYTLTKVNPNSNNVYNDGFYIESPSVNKLLRKYFDIQNISKKPNEYYNMLLNLLQDNAYSLDDYCNMVTKNKALFKKMHN